MIRLRGDSSGLIGNGASLEWQCHDLNFGAASGGEFGYGTNEHPIVVRAGGATGYRRNEFELHGNGIGDLDIRGRCRTGVAQLN